MVHLGSTSTFDSVPLFQNDIEQEILIRKGLRRMSVKSSEYGSLGNDDIY
jgi:hypothetical protein